ncbi:hypothetical protein CA3LBN_003068 [Candidozyma haemuli]|uniref:Uncharacterized protein n=1 Tax=Candidozyma haemuli TaxID=45357 RepID=A0ABX8IA45_9ASCO|nr:hypothetical protein CA3LBN_003068 [[Candida] haemuloni]
MEEALDLEAQNPGPDVDKKPKAINVLVDRTITGVERFGRAIRNKFAAWKIPLFLYQAWLAFFIIYSCMTMFSTKLGVVTYKYDSSLSLKMNQAVNSLELAMEGSTKNLSSMLPQQWPNGLYMVGHFAVCRKNQNSKKVCYRGKKLEDLVLKDIGIQIAEYNEMEDPAAFGESFLVTYRDVQQNLKEVSSVKKHCRYFEEKTICGFEGLTAEEYSYLPSTKAAENPPFICPYIYLVLAALSFTALSLTLWVEDDVFAGIVLVVSSSIQVYFILLSFLEVPDCFHQKMSYFVDESCALALTVYFLAPLIPVILGFIMAISVSANTPD